MAGGGAGRGTTVVGAAVPPGPGRALAAVAHLNIAGPLALSVLGLLGGAGGGALGFGLYLAIFWTLGDAVLWILVRRMSSPAASHASQAFWVASAAFAAFVVLVFFSGSAALGFVVLAPCAAFGALGAWRVLRGGGHRYPGVAVLIEGRRR